MHLVNKNRLLLLTLCAAFAHNTLAADDKLDRDYPGRMLQGGDPLVYQQWNLLNTGQDAFAAMGGTPGIDLNLWRTHKKGILGQGVIVAVVDDGLEINHLNLAANIKKGSKNFVDNTNDPTPTDPDSAHGTSVAGIIGAVGYNNIGTRGVAPKVGLKGFNWLEDQSLDSWLLSHGWKKNTHNVRVFNQSYGSSPIFGQPYNLDNDYEQYAMEYVYENISLNAHRKKGALFVKSAGNGYRKTVIGLSSGRYSVMPADYDAETPNEGLPWQNSNLSYSNANYWNMTVSALNADGVLSSYSSVGSNVFLTAPGGEYGRNKPAHVTTDLTGCDMGYNTYGSADDNGLHGGTAQSPNCNYNGVMNGTSSAAPNTSGAVALLMSKFPKLSQRDIRHLLASTATKVDPDYQDIETTYTTNQGTERTVTGLEGWSTNAAGYDYSPYYGFGLIDVDRAVKMGKTVAKLPRMKITDWQTRTPELAIPDAGTQAVSDSVLVNRDLTVEAVQVKIDIDHERLSDLLIELVSPSGTRSILMSPRNNLVGRSLYEFIGQELGEEASGYRDQLLLSHKFYGEPAVGNWRLEVTDTSAEDKTWVLQNRKDKTEVYNVPWSNNQEPGVINNWSIRVLGHKSA